MRVESAAIGRLRLRRVDGTMVSGLGREELRVVLAEHLSRFDAAAALRTIAAALEVVANEKVTT
jgi:hypothetical protein